MSDRTLSIGEAVALAQVIGMAQRGDHVRWLDEDGDVLEGTARHICHADATFLTNEVDVRDAYLRITAGLGDVMMPVSVAVGLVRNGEMASEER